MNTTLRAFQPRDILIYIIVGLERTHGGVPEALTGCAVAKVKVLFVDRLQNKGLKEE